MTGAAGPHAELSSPVHVSLLATIKADLVAAARLQRGSVTARTTIDVAALPGSCAVMLFRLASACHRDGLRPLSRILYFLNVVLFGADLAPGAKVGPGLVIGHPVGIGWGTEFTAGRNLVLTGAARFGTAAADDPARDGQPTLGDEVIMLDGAKAMGPVTIGDRAVVAANTLVLEDVPAEAIVVGQPARIAKMRSDRSRGQAVRRHTPPESACAGPGG